MRSKLSAITARTPKQQRALRGPVARRSRAVLLARDDQQRRAFFLIFHRGVVDEHLLARGHVRGPAAFGSGRELVAQPDIGERSAHHHFMVAAARAVGIEIAGLDAVRDQEFSGRAVGGNIAGGRDVIGGDGIAEHREHANEPAKSWTDVWGSTIFSK